MEPIQVLFLILACVLFIMGLLMSITGEYQFMRGWEASKVEDPKAYGRHLGKVIMAVSLVPLAFVLVNFIAGPLVSLIAAAVVLVLVIVGVSKLSKK